MYIDFPICSVVRTYENEQWRWSPWKEEMVMITYEEALEIGKHRKPNADTCVEYETAYMFTAEEDANYIGGYGHCAIVVSKEDGSFLKVHDFLMKGEEEIKETRLKNELTYVEPADYFPKEIREKYFGKDDEIE